MAGTISNMMRLIPLGKMNYESANCPKKMANQLDIAYGGCVFSMAVNAACQSVPLGEYQLYSVLGYFLGGTITTAKVTVDVEDIRTTKTFITRKVVVKQVQKGVERQTFYTIVDFHKPDPTVMSYSISPKYMKMGPEDLKNDIDNYTELVAAGKLQAKHFDRFMDTFGLWEQFFEYRPLPDSMFAQKMMGINKSAKTTQDHLHMKDKYTACWTRCKTALTEAENYGAMAFLLDGALAYMPATFNNEFLEDYAAASSLDFAMRIHQKFNVHDWHFLEQTTEVGACGKTWSTGRLFNTQGELVATMSQSSVMRGKPGRPMMKL